MSDEDVATIRRLFIGNLSPELYRTPEDLTKRISKFGVLKSELELHFNEVRHSGFGYLDVEITSKQYSNLRSSLNAVVYKGSKLVIDVAKNDFQKSWEEDNQNRSDELAKAKLLKQQYENYKKLENIKKSFRDRIELIPGRLRQAPRKDIKKMTLRVNFNGEIKTVRCRKTKLWGYEKNKKLRDLVYKFSNSVWKDGNDHIVERISQIKIKQGDNTLSLSTVYEPRDDEKLLETPGDKEDEEMEMEKNSKVLASLLGNFDFDKKLDYKEEVDEFAGSDYEYNGSDLDDSDDDNNKSNVNNGDLSHIEYVKEGEFGKQSQRPNTVSFDEDDNEEDYSIYTKHDERMDIDQPKEDKIEENQEEDEDEDQDLEFLPTFGQAEPENVTSTTQSTLIEGTVSNTETLRTLFNDTEQGTFNLVEESDEDIDKTKTPIVTNVVLPDQTQIIQTILPMKAKQKKGLFFPHLDSPFLVAQTQLNKLNTNVDLEQFDEKFWDNRGEWTREFKRRKRDHMRQMQKKNAKNARVYV